jgi:hypothetical protein
MPQPINTSTLIDGITFDTAVSRLSLKTELANAVKANRCFYNGDHWQKGDGWIGPSPSDNNPQAALIYEKFRHSFVSKNMIAECVDREWRAVIGRQPDWTITVRRPLDKVVAQVPSPSDPTKMIDDPSGRMVDGPPNADEQKLIDEAAALLTPWWDQRQVLKALQTAATKRVNLGRGAVRPFVPQDNLSTTGRVKTMKIEDAIMLVYVDTPEPEDACVFTESSSMKQLSIVRVKDTEVDDEDEGVTIELSALTGEKKTVVVNLTKESDGGEPAGDGATLTKADATATAAGDESQPESSDASEPLDLGGRLALHVMEGRALTSDQVRQNQRLLNLALTMCGHNVVEAGFSERTITNAEMPGHMVPDATVEGGQRFVPDPLPRGPGVSTNLAGLQYTDENGVTHVLDPKIYYREPAPVTTFVQTKELAVRDIYEEVHQQHALISGDATASGESRIQALADFVMNCLELKGDVDSAGQYLLEIALAYAAQLSGAAGKFAALRINFDCKIDTGKLTPAERSALQAEVAARLLSRESYMLIAGRQDPQAELAAIKREEAMFPAPAPPVAPKPPNPAAGSGA